MGLSGQATRSWPIGVVVGVVASVLSIARLWLFDRDAPEQVLWAEDGLFTLCIHKAGFWTCLTDSFAGYLLFLPRVLAWPVSLLPWEYWAIAANLVAAALVGAVTTFVVIILRRFGLGWFTSIVIALLPVTAPMLGLESINAIGSSYMLLLFIATFVVTLPPASLDHLNSPSYTWAGGVLMLVTALTIPSAVLLAVLVVIMMIRASWPLRTAVVWLIALLVGLVAQLYVAVNAEAPRQVSFGYDTVVSWVDSIPVSLLTYWPGLSLGTYDFFTNFTLSPLGITNWLVAGVMLGLGVFLVIRGSRRKIAIGLLILAGLGLGLIPSAIGFANNRYFVVPLLLWGAALLIALDDRIRRTRPWVLTLVTVIVVLMWWPAFPVSAYRGTPAPPWTDEVSRIEARCIAEPDAVERPLFTPFWPPNWGDGLIEPTHPNLPCTIVWRWAG